MSRNLRWIRVLTTTAIALQVLWYLLPGIEIDWLNEDELVILQYGAFGSIINIPEWSYWAFLAANLVVLGLVLVWGRRFRHMLLGFFLLSVLVFVPSGGMVIETGISMTLRDLSNLAIGGIIAMLYFAQ